MRLSEHNKQNCKKISNEHEKAKIMKKFEIIKQKKKMTSKKV